MKYILALIALLWVVPASAATTKISFDFEKTSHTCVSYTGTNPADGTCGIFVPIAYNTIYSGSITIGNTLNQATVANDVTCDFAGIACPLSYFYTNSSPGNYFFGDPTNFQITMTITGSTGLLSFVDDASPDSFVDLALSNVTISSVPLPASALLLIGAFGALVRFKLPARPLSP